MRLSEIKIDQNKRLLEYFYSDKVGIAYNLYESFQEVTNDFVESASDLYDESYAVEMIHVIIRLIELLQEDNVPTSTQIMIALNELLVYFNKK